MVDDSSTTEASGSEVDDLLQKVEFGAQLSQAREQAGLSVSDVAEKLLISEDIIRAIDNSRSDLLPAATFTQGYIRSYARILKLNADSIISEYNRVVPETKQILTPHSVLPAQKTTATQMLVRLVMIALVVGIAVIFFWIYDSGYRLPEIPSAKSPVSKDVIEPALPDINPVSQIESTSPSDDASDSFIIQENQPALDVPVESALTEDGESEVESLSSTSAPAAPAAATDLARLSVTALQESWCEITDANGERLIYRLLAASEEVSVEGELPFRVFLGNARQVRLELNNTILDFDHLIRSNRNTVNLEVLSESSVERYKAR